MIGSIERACGGKVHERKAEASNVTKSSKESFSKCRRCLIESKRLLTVKDVQIMAGRRLVRVFNF